MYTLNYCKCEITEFVSIRSSIATQVVWDILTRAYLFCRISNFVAMEIWQNIV